MPKTINDLEQQNAALQAEVERLEQANELDRRSLWATVRAIDEEITGRMWLIEGRGSYEWDDDRYKQEFSWAVKALQDKLEPLRKIAHDLTNCPKTEKGVDSVRKLEKERDSLREQLRTMQEPVSELAQISIRIRELNSPIRSHRCTEESKPDWQSGDSGQPPCMWDESLDVADLCDNCKIAKVAREECTKAKRRRYSIVRSIAARAAREKEGK